ncbi:hypothetical protein [Halolamina salifodinae]|uniref:Uncharacterized protein n=1 Tax=Halolamina salifodinae TaxID=1202767 RepID=A0A8T4GUQ0_9EURY|nr:hypothetical protein [Halolamina salifodinae]MBP1986767.1 hypothetical protein [Halolamina salifodinae]
MTENSIEKIDSLRESLLSYSTVKDAQFSNNAFGGSEMLDLILVAGDPGDLEERLKQAKERGARIRLNCFRAEHIPFRVRQLADEVLEADRGECSWGKQAVGA